MKKPSKHSLKNKHKNNKKSDEFDLGSGFSTEDWKSIASEVRLESVLDEDQLELVKRDIHGFSEESLSLLRLFQSNLISLISHELRTPLMGVMNALELLTSQEGISGDLSSEEIFEILLKNSRALNDSLTSIIELASIETGTFHAAIREVDLVRLMTNVVENETAKFESESFSIHLSFLKKESAGTINVLIDPKKMIRAIELLFQFVRVRMKPGTSLRVQVSQTEIYFQFTLNSEPLDSGETLEEEWDRLWDDSLPQAGESLSPLSSFAGMIQSESDFLSRSREGLGTEWTLVHEILRIHEGSFASIRKENNVVLTFHLPALNDEKSLIRVLRSRIEKASFGLDSLALVILEAPNGFDFSKFLIDIENALFRSTDSVYPLTESKKAALILDDCRPQDIPGLVARLMTPFGVQIKFGTAHCPMEVRDADQMLHLALSRLKKSDSSDP